jgi:hypothetical protein
MIQRRRSSSELVLKFHLKRFEYDVYSPSMIKINDSPSMIKINDRYEFPLLLNLDKDSGQYLSPDSMEVCGTFI